MSVEKSNRVEAELMNWQQKEQKFQSLFSFELSSNKALLREKLHDFERIAVKYKNTTDPDERFTLQMLKQERRHLEKKCTEIGWLDMFAVLWLIRFANILQRETMKRSLK